MDNNEIVKEMQEVALQMYKDDIEEDPEIENEYFDCSCCGEYKTMAGSIQYGKYRLCNNCVVLAEVGFKLNKFKDIQELIDAMEDKRLEVMCEFIKQDEKSVNN